MLYGSGVARRYPPLARPPARPPARPLPYPFLATHPWCADLLPFLSRRYRNPCSERDPACDSYHDCLLYFKGFQALQTHRVAHWLYRTGRHALAFYLQSQVRALREV